MPLFHKNPNLCASVFNDELHAAFGKNRVIPLFKHFTANGRLWHGGLGGSSPTICQKFYNRDGLHFNMTGSKLLGALISQFIFKGLQENPTQKKLALAKPAGSPTSSMQGRAVGVVARATRAFGRRNRRRAQRLSSFKTPSD